MALHLDHGRTDAGPETDQTRAASGPHSDCVRPESGPHPDRRIASCPQIDDFSTEVIASRRRWGLDTGLMEPMQLKPKMPPGRSSRKALRYVHEVRRLRAEGHTLESIRLALLDAGISVSLSTVRREAARPASKWELARAQEVPLAPEELQPSRVAQHTGPSPRQPWRFGALGGQPTGPFGAESGLASIEAAGDRLTFGLFSRFFGTLRRLRNAKQVP